LSEGDPQLVTELRRFQRHLDQISVDSANQQRLHLLPLLSLLPKPTRLVRLYAVTSSSMSFTHAMIPNHYY
jgi:hypothetical protein